MEGFFSKKETESSSISNGKFLSCYSCKLFKETDRPKLEYSGKGERQILNIITSPDRREYSTLKSIYKKQGIDLEKDCWNYFAVRCKSSEVSPFQIDCCRKFLLKTIKDLKPKVIAVFGKLALYSVIGSRWKKDFGEFTKWQGWEIPDQDLKSWIVPIYPVSMLKEKGNDIYRLLINKDISKVIKLCDKDLYIYKEPEIIYLNENNLSELSSIKSLRVAFDYETTGLKPYSEEHKIVCASIAVDPDKVYSFPIPSERKKLKPFLDFLRNEKILKIAHNMKYEDTWSKIILKTEVKSWNFDTMLGAHTLDNRSNITNLKFQTYVLLGIIDYDSEVNPYLKSDDEKNSNAVNKINTLWRTKEGRKKVLQYCAYDSINEYRVYENQIEQFKQRAIENDSPQLGLAYSHLHDGILSFAKSERQGFRIDLEYCKNQNNKLTRRIKRLEKDIIGSKFYKEWKIAFSGKAINLNSHAQLSKFLYEIKNLKPLKYTDKEKPSTDEEALQALKIPELDLIIKRFKLLKIRDTYLNAYITEQVDSYVHPFFNLHLARTYRSSSSNPNLQNVPKRDKVAMKLIRKSIYPRKGNLLFELDYSAVEVAVGCAYHKDPTMIKYIKESHDMHGDMASQIFLLDNFDKSISSHSLLRGSAKNGFVFPQFYGDYYKNNADSICSTWVDLPTIRKKWDKNVGIELENDYYLSEHLISKGIKSYADFEKHLQEIEYHFWNKRFPVYNSWRDSNYENYLKTGKVDLYTGFQCRGIMSKKDTSNYPIQGTAFHCLLWSYTKIMNKIETDNMNSILIGQIHDAVLGDVPPDEVLKFYNMVQKIGTKDILKKFEWINVPLKMEAEICPIDGSWAEKKDWNPDI